MSTTHSSCSCRGESQDRLEKTGEEGNPLLFVFLQSRGAAKPRGDVSGPPRYVTGCNQVFHRQMWTAILARCSCWWKAEEFSNIYVVQEPDAVVFAVLVTPVTTMRPCGKYCRQNTIHPWRVFGHYFRVTRNTGASKLLLDLHQTPPSSEVLGESWSRRYQLSSEDDQPLPSISPDPWSCG